MIPPDVIHTLRGAQRRLPNGTWQQVCGHVQQQTGVITEASVDGMLVAVSNPDVAWALREKLTAAEGTPWQEVGAVLQTLNQLSSDSGAPLDVIWSGPSSARFAARRTDQVLYDLLARAIRRALIVTFSAYRVERLCHELMAAHQRGVQITLLLETEADSEGQLSKDALNAFAGLPLDKFTLLRWPKLKRPLNAAGRPGKLHAKCAVIDDAVVVGSANLTDDAFNRNIEMGLVAHDAALANAIVAHFAELEAGKSLIAIDWSPH